MLRRTYFLPLLVGATFAAGCGGAEEAEEMGEPQASEIEVAAGSDLECYIARGTFEETQERPSPLHLTRFPLDGGEGLLCYGAPSANGRDVMGALVPYDAPWRIGANEPTTLHLNAAASVGGVTLEPGSYSLYAVPTSGDWEFFVNSTWERWGIPISEEVRATEMGSFTATPGATSGMVEVLSYTWADGNLVLEWENTRVEIPVQPAG